MDSHPKCTQNIKEAKVIFKNIIPQLSLLVFCGPTSNLSDVKMNPFRIHLGMKCIPEMTKISNCVYDTVSMNG